MPHLSKKLSILDVGHGNSAVLVDDNGIVVIDAGPGSALLEFLEQEGIESIDVLLISHADADHIRGVIGLVGSESVEVKRVYLNSDALKDSDLWDHLLYTLDKTHRAEALEFETSLHRGHTGIFTQGHVEIEVLAPSQYLAAKGPGSTDRDGNILTSNSMSAVIRLVRSGKPLAMFPGDIDEIGLANLLRENDDLRTSIVVFPHHGGHPGKNANLIQFTTDLCRAVQPETVVFSIGRGQHNTPQPDIVATVRAIIPRVYIACTQLSKRCALDLPDTDGSYLANAYARGREQGKCCAGTLIVNLEIDKVALEPGIRHQAFVKVHIQNALCQRSVT